tara:strand:- start:65 stop:322 length:258 start_codon:yes stop_codon:yes gene_type:complete
MTKGDLVKVVEYFYPENTPEGKEEREQWSQPGVIIKGPYEAQIDHADPSGKVKYVELVKAVDIMVGPDTIKRVPVKYLRRVADLV